MSPLSAAEGAPSQARVLVNGTGRAVPAGTRLLDLLAAEGLDARRVAVERNGLVVRRADHEALVVADGDVFEVVQFVGGG